MNSGLEKQVLNIEIQKSDPIHQKHVRVDIADEVIHADIVNLRSAQARNRFAAKVASRIPGTGIRVADIEGNLVRALNAQVEHEREFLQQRKLARGDGLKAIPNVEVVGIDGQDRVLLLAKDSGRMRRYSLRSLSYAELLLFAGPEFGDRFDETAMPNIRRFIAIHARRQDIRLLERRGQGFSSLDGRLLLVCGSQACSWDGATAKSHHGPVNGGNFFEFDSSRRWCNLEKVIAIATSMDREKLQSIHAKLRRIFGKFQYQHPLDHQLVLALAIATPLSSVWERRGQVAVTGRTTTGKSTLCDAFGDLLGSLALKCSGHITAATLRRSIGHDNLVPLLDEFEKGPEREEILELMRTATRGGNVRYAGAPGTQECTRVDWMSWLFSIELNLKREADRNRYFQIELLGIDGDPPDRQQITGFREEFFGLATWMSLRARSLANAIRFTKVPDVPPRLVEIHSVPAAIISLFTKFEPTPDHAEAVLRSLLKDRASVRMAQLRDEEELLEAILLAGIRPRLSSSQEPDGKTVLVSTVGEQLRAKDQSDGLERFGVRRVNGGDVFLVGRKLTETILRQTKWASLDIDSILARLPGTKRTRLRIAGGRSYGIVVPNTLLGETQDCPTTAAFRTEEGQA